MLPRRVESSPACFRFGVLQHAVPRNDTSCTAGNTVIQSSDQMHSIYSISERGYSYEINPSPCYIKLPLFIKTDYSSADNMEYGYIAYGYTLRSAIDWQSN